MPCRVLKLQPVRSLQIGHQTFFGKTHPRSMFLIEINGNAFFKEDSCGECNDFGQERMRMEDREISIITTDFFVFGVRTFKF